MEGKSISDILHSLDDCLPIQYLGLCSPLQLIAWSSLVNTYIDNLTLYILSNDYYEVIMYNRILIIIYILYKYLLFNIWSIKITYFKEGERSNLVEWSRAYLASGRSVSRLRLRGFESSCVFPCFIYFLVFISLSGRGIKERMLRKINK